MFLSRFYLGWTNVHQYILNNNMLKTKLYDKLSHTNQLRIKRKASKEVLKNYLVWKPQYS